MESFLASVTRVDLLKFPLVHGVGKEECIISLFVKNSQKADREDASNIKQSHEGHRWRHFPRCVHGIGAPHYKPRHDMGGGKSFNLDESAKEMLKSLGIRV